MKKNRVISYLFILLGLLITIGTAYVIAAYASEILKSVVDFVTTNDYSKLRQCGINTPPQFDRVKSDLTTLILPFLYAGLPVLFLIVSTFMFYAGAHHARAKLEEDADRNEQIKQDVVNKMARKEMAKSATNASKTKETKVLGPKSSSTENDNEDEE
ncbi:MAG: hypothetical protein ACP5N9_05875 [Candidatus Bilamarchaeum sp.]